MPGALALLVSLALLLGACGGPAAGPPGSATRDTSSQTAGVPPLPFPDNPDPTQCGIPTVWGKDDPAWITGYYQGRLVEPAVALYDSHLRKAVVGRIPHGGRVRIALAQANPALNYYQVRSLDLDPPQEGWVPAPFVALDGPPPPAP